LALCSGCKVGIVIFLSMDIILLVAKSCTYGKRQRREISSSKGEAIGHSERRSGFATH
jgi:hypothetical protein